MLFIFLYLSTTITTLKKYHENNGGFGSVLFVPTLRSDTHGVENCGEGFSHSTRDKILYCRLYTMGLV